MKRDFVERTFCIYALASYACFAVRKEVTIKLGANNKDSFQCKCLCFHPLMINRRMETPEHYCLSIQMWINESSVLKWIFVSTFFVFIFYDSLYRENSCQGASSTFEVERRNFKLSQLSASEIFPSHIIKKCWIKICLMSLQGFFSNWSVKVWDLWCHLKMSSWEMSQIFLWIFFLRFKSGS